MADINYKKLLDENNNMGNTPPPQGINTNPEINTGGMPLAKGSASDADSSSSSSLPNLNTGNVDNKLWDMGPTQNNNTPGDWGFQDNTNYPNLDTTDERLIKADNLVPPPADDDDLDWDDLETEAMGAYSAYAMNEDPMVASEQRRLERNNLLRLDQSKRAAHEMAVNAGYLPGTAQYEELLRNAVTDAENQNITATNALHDFMRQRRSDRQGELMNIYEEGVQADDKAWNRMEDMSKFIGSVAGQEAFARAHIAGVPLEDAIANLYDADGNLKSDYKDKTHAELVKAGLEDAVGQMKTNPDGADKPWTEEEKKAYVEKFYQDNFENLVYGTQLQTEERTEEQEEDAARDDRVSAYFKDNDPSKMLPGDWEALTDSQRAEIQEKAVKFNTLGISKDYGSGWTDEDANPDNMSDSTALKLYKAKTKVAVGQHIEKNGVVYIVTQPAVIRGAGDGGDNKRVVTKAINTQTGKEVEINSSWKFENW